eukprot:12893770-Prorocentrum_lima.AAC.1
MEAHAGRNHTGCNGGHHREGLAACKEAERRRSSFCEAAYYRYKELQVTSVGEDIISCRGVQPSLQAV